MSQDFGNAAKFHEPPRPVGAYDWGHVFVEVTRKPNWFQRLMIRWFFGWKWVDRE
ncbi:MAG TPA: hypothetical protein VII92_19220 [Anaerolineae bacterium]